LKNFIEQGKKICCDENKLNEKLYEIVKSGAIQKESVIEHIKSKKNETEMEGMRNCNIRDCAAIMKYFGWLED
jgi:Xaa-Pro aminopeptidase